MSTQEVTSKHRNLCLVVSCLVCSSPTWINFISLIHFLLRIGLSQFRHSPFSRSLHLPYYKTICTCGNYRHSFILTCVLGICYTHCTVTHCWYQWTKILSSLCYWSILDNFMHDSLCIYVINMWRVAVRLFESSSVLLKTNV